MDEVPHTRERLVKRTIFFSKLKRRILKHVWLVRIGLIVLLILSTYLFFGLAGLLLKKTVVGYYAGLSTDFVFTPQDKIESIEGRTNVLILGKGGEGHEAPDLTDTIIFASFSHPTTPALRGASNKASITLISLPRDIWIPALRAKLNSTYYWGNQKQPPVQRASGPEGGGGLILAKSTVEEIVGAPVHYGVVVDFSGFARIIGVLGGIEIDVERAFIDEKYPIPGREDDECEGDPEYKCRYETIRFEKGLQLMDGEKALKFVRSRNAEGEEGTDLARAARQQKVLVALRRSILNPKIMLSPKKILTIISVVRESVETDIGGSASAILARRVLQSDEQAKTQILPEEFLERPPKSPRYDNLYVFIPKEGDWREIHEWIESLLNTQK